jgi:hypothetical protein
MFCVNSCPYLPISFLRRNVILGGLNLKKKCKKKKVVIQKISLFLVGGRKRELDLCVDKKETASRGY